MLFVLLSPPPPTKKNWTGTSSPICFRGAGGHTQAPNDRPKKNCCVTTYHCVILTVVTHITVSFIGALTMLITQTLDRAVGRCPTKVTFADFRENTAALVTAFGADWLTCSTREIVQVIFSFSRAIKLKTGKQKSHKFHKTMAFF